jgi:hypothetical protein
MKKFIIILLAVAALGITGCEKWLDVNHNPNDATKATPDLILPGVLTNWLSDIQSLTTTTGAWMGYWYHAGGWSGWYSEKKYEITASYLDLTGYYTGQLTDNRFIRINSGTNVVYPAITNVVDAWYYARMIDCVGDVPYTEACQPDLTLTPKYDDAKTIWLDLITRLDTSIAVFNRAATASDRLTNPVYTFATATDVIYGGNFASWVKFANTLKLRMVMRLTNIYTPAELKAMMDNTVSKGFITASVTGNPGYSASSGKTNPWWNTFGKSYTGTIVSATTQYALNAYIHRKLVLLADPRLQQYFFAGPSAAPAGTLVSTKYGTDGDLIAQPNTTVAGNYTFMPLAADWTTKVTGNGALDRCVIFNYPEALFLQAEAISRGIIAGGNAAAGTAYTAGMTASLTWAKVTPANQTTYLANTGILWDPAWTATEQLEHIINQKWIANYFLNCFESYCDYRRTGYPNPKKAGYAIDAVNDPNFEMLSYYPGGIIRRQIPRRFPYPQSEINLNKVNVQAAIDLEIAKNSVTFTTDSWPFDARVFWDTAPKTIPYNY